MQVSNLRVSLTLIPALRSRDAKSNPYWFDYQQIEALLTEIEQSPKDGVMADERIRLGWDLRAILRGMEDIRKNSLLHEERSGSLTRLNSSLLACILGAFSVTTKFAKVVIEWRIENARLKHKRA